MLSFLFLFLCVRIAAHTCIRDLFVMIFVTHDGDVSAIQSSSTFITYDGRVACADGSCCRRCGARPWTDEAADGCLPHNNISLCPCCRFHYSVLQTARKVLATTPCLPHDLIRDKLFRDRRSIQSLFLVRHFHRSETTLIHLLVSRWLLATVPRMQERRLLQD